MTVRPDITSEIAETLEHGNSPSMPIAIELSHVSKRYAMFAKPEDRLKQMVVPRVQRLMRATPARYFREFAAINDVSLTVRRGETVGIIGRNGSGKSTLLQMIVGTLMPTSGTVNVHGRIAALLELGAGFNPEFTGRENVYVNGAILGFSREEMDEKFEAIAAFANIGEFIERPVKTYSSGMFVRLAFAVSTAVEPDILVVDEALSVGDEAFQRKCFARIEAIKERGGTILFVSHGAQTIVQLCDRAVLMEAGVKILEGEPKAVVGQYQRLVNASDEGAAKVKDEILAMGGIARAKPVKSAAVSALATGPIASVTSETNVEDDDEEDGLADYFDLNLKSESTVYLQERGARITNLKIVTLNGKHVNVIWAGNSYKIEFDVNFATAVQNVGFGFQFRTASGLAIIGAHSSQNPLLRLKSVHAGSIQHVSFSFDCKLLPQTYFIVCGVRGSIDSEEILLHRIYDAVPIRVVQNNISIATGMVDAITCFSSSEFNG